MRKLLLLAFVVLAFAGESFAAEKWINFVNRADVDIRGISLAPAGTEQFGDDLLLRRKLKVGRTTKLSVPHDRGNCQWDIKYVGPKGMTFTIRDVDICKAVEIQLFLKDGNAWANIK